MRAKTALAAVAMLASVMVAMTVSTPPASAAARGNVMRAAAAYAASQGYYAGIAVIDTRTGQTYTSGHARRPFVAASVVKVLIATRLLVTDRMHGRVAKLAYRMITQSDNDATDKLYPLAGGASIEPWAERHYHVADLGSPTGTSGWWGYTRLIPLGLARLYVKIKKDPKVAPWLLNAMHHIRETSYVGEYQWWGLPSATTHAAVKQGWDIAFGHANVNTTGFVNRDRYAVTIMTRGPTSSYLGPISRMITHVARLLLPDGHFPPPLPRVTSLSRTSGPAYGGWRVTVRGSAFTHVARVMFGDRRGLDLVVRSSARLTVTAPPHAAGWVYVRVVTPHGTSPKVSADRFRYVARPSVSSVQPPVGRTAGGTMITVTGHNFLHVTKVLVGGVAATSVSVNSATRLNAITSAHAAGVVDVRVITSYGRSVLVTADRYLYDDPPPEVTAAQATADPGAIDLTWTNPDDASFAGVKICRSIDATPPASTCAPLAVVPAPGVAYSDGDITAGATYYYTLFSYDAFGQYSPGVTVQAAR